MLVTRLQSLVHVTIEFLQWNFQIFVTHLLATLNRRVCVSVLKVRRKCALSWDSTTIEGCFHIRKLIFYDEAACDVVAAGWLGWRVVCLVGFMLLSLKGGWLSVFMLLFHLKHSIDAAEGVRVVSNMTEHVKLSYAPTYPLTLTTKPLWKRSREKTQCFLCCDTLHGKRMERELDVKRASGLHSYSLLWFKSASK